MGGAHAVYQQLREKKKEDYSQIKSTGFATGDFLAYEQFAE